MASDPDSGSGDTPKDVPKIEFPCLYPIKIIGIASEAFRDTVVMTVERHTGSITRDLIKVTASKNNNYLSVTVTIAATGEQQLRSIFTDLKAVAGVKLVL
ncbi:MAG: DUF493 domain-containing protein [Gammaproteobacteria bacterium]